jgi:large subunit ribosomal protein L24
MRKFHIKKNDEVVVISGTEKGKRGRVLQVLQGKERAIVEGCKMIKRHTRKSQMHPNGAIVEREGTIHVSNLMLVSKYEARAAKRGAVAPAAS